MHISEGVLSVPVLTAGWVIAGAGVAVGLRKIKSENIARVSLISSVFFLASLVNIRIGPGSTHLSLIAPVGLILGWASFPAIMAALLLQAVLFSFGGLLVLGVNTVDMAFPAVIVFLLFSGQVRSARNYKVAAALAFVAGAVAVLMGAMCVGLSLGLSDGDFTGVAKIIFAAHIPLAAVEGIVTAFMVLWLRKAAPEFLELTAFKK